LQADALLEIFEHVVKPLGAEVTNVVAEIAKKEPITFDQFARDHASAFSGMERTRGHSSALHPRVKKPTLKPSM
jgi:hypothetical protein